MNWRLGSAAGHQFVITGLRSILKWFTRHWRKLAVALFLVSPLFFLPASRSTLQLEARTEVLEFQVTNVEGATFDLDRALLRMGDRKHCLSGLHIRPRLGARVRYERFGRERAIVLITSPGHDAVEITPAKHMGQNRVARWPADIGSPGSIVYLFLGADPAVASCLGPTTVRLPVRGIKTEVGRELTFTGPANSPPLTLLSGQVRLLLRAVEHIGPVNLVALDVGIRKVFPDGLFGADTLFTAEELALPAGAKVLTPHISQRAKRRTDAPMPTGGMDETPEWWGFADIDFTNLGGRGMLVTAWSSAGALDVLLPFPVGGGGQSSERLRVSVSFVGRCLSDPHIRIIIVLISVALTMVNIFPTRRQKSEESGTGDSRA